MMGLYTKCGIVFGRVSCTLEAGPKETKKRTNRQTNSQDTRSFSLSLSFTVKWELGWQCQRKGACLIDHSHTHFDYGKPITTCQKKESLCALKSSKCMGDSTIELVFNPCGGVGAGERGVITVH